MKPETSNALVGRLAEIRVLREHHVWDAAEIVGLDRSGDRSQPRYRKFRVLMEADALVDAVLHLAATAIPPRLLQASAHGERWTCSTRVVSSRRSHKAEHADLAAAMLASLLLTFPSRRAPRRRRINPTRHANEVHRHDH